MKLKTILVATMAAVCINSYAAPALTTDKAKVSYIIGVDMGQNFKTQGIDIDPEVLVAGLTDGLAGNKPLLTQAEMQAALKDFQSKIVAKQKAAFEASSTANLKAGDAYLAQNKQQPGVVTLPSGLQYKVIKEGTGAMPKDGDKVTVNYAGSTIDGKEFDSSYKRNKPAEFVLSKDLIPGWVEAIKLMKTGAVWQVYIPASLGYGEKGIGPIGPNQTLVFKIELLGVTPAKDVKGS